VRAGAPLDGARYDASASRHEREREHDELLANLAEQHAKLLSISIEEARARLLAAASPTANADPWEELLTEQPGAGAWVSFYELDGDRLFADIERDRTIWVGGEWTGDWSVEFRVPWRRSLNFVLRQMFERGEIRPNDLEMLASA